MLEHSPAGVCLVTSGPGATNLVTGIATVNYDSIPLVCFTGQVPTGPIGKHSFQEVDIVGITKSICKYAVTVRKREDLADIIQEAFYIARTGKPGVAVVDLPKDIQREYGSDITGKTEQFAANAAVIHVDIDETAISRNIAADVPIAADAKTVICKLLEMAKPLTIEVWVEQIRKWKTQYPVTMKKAGMTPEKIIRSISRTLDNAVIATDVGQNQLWAAQFLDLNEKRKMLTSGGLGTMGYGLPAAIGARIGNPDRDVVVISGDGGMQMNIQEMATAVVYELPIIICIFNNGYLGNVRQWQELFFERRYASTCMRYRKSCIANCNRPTECCPEYTPDFIKLAESYGAKGIRVTEEKDILTALETAKNNRKVPTIIEFIVDREENVMPIVPPGNALSDMILEIGNN